MAKVKRTGFLQELLNSFIGVFVGIVLVLVAIVVLFLNEVRPNAADAAKAAKELTATNSASLDGQSVWIKGALKSDDPITDTQYLLSGEYVAIYRKAEIYAYIEHEETTTEDNWGGGTTKTTTYTYTREWVDVADMPSSASFDEPDTHSNPTPSIVSSKNTAESITIEGYNVQRSSYLVIDGMTRLSITSSSVVSDKGTVENNYIYTTKNAQGTDTVGDQRVSFYVLNNNTTGILLASLSGNDLNTLNFTSKGVFKTSSSIYRFFSETDINAVIARLEAENKVILWVLRVVGFVLMLMAFAMILNPIKAVAGIIPFIKKLTGGAIFIVSFLGALVISTIVIIVANILNNIFALIALIALIILLIVLTIKRANNKKAQKPARQK